jgi:hypothetical protein
MPNIDTTHLDLAAAEAIKSYNERDHRCVACFADEIEDAAQAHGLDAVVLLRHAVRAISESHHGLN